MATRNVVYQFGEYVDGEFKGIWAAYDRNTEQARIDEVEAQGSYIGKYDINMEEREIVDGKPIFEVVDGELIVREETIYDAVPGALLPPEAGI